MALLVAACASEGLPPHRKLVPLWREFTQMPSERALAVAGDPNRVWVGAATGGAPSREEAEERALDECRARRLARRMQAPCRIYASGDEIVW